MTVPLDRAYFLDRLGRARDAALPTRSLASVNGRVRIWSRQEATDRGVPFGTPVESQLPFPTTKTGGAEATAGQGRAPRDVANPPEHARPASLPGPSSLAALDLPASELGRPPPEPEARLDDRPTDRPGAPSLDEELGGGEVGFDVGGEVGSQVAGHPDCPYCDVEPVHCPRGHQFWHVDPKDVLPVVYGLDFLITGRVAAKVGVPLPSLGGMPERPITADDLAEAYAKVARRFGGGLLARYGDFFGMFGLHAASVYQRTMVGIELAKQQQASSGGAPTTGGTASSGVG